MFPVYDIRKISQLPKQKKVEFNFDGFVPNDINGYALVLTNKLVSIGSDGQKFFGLI